MPFLETDDGEIFCRVHGHGPALVLVHAISAGLGMWEAQVERFSRDHQVIVFDARGVGRSAPIRGWRGVRDPMAEDIALLLDELGHERAAICGVSFGGVIAQHFAARCPVLGVGGESSWPRSITFMEEMRTAVPRMRLVLVPDAGDPTPLCRPDAFDEILAGFLTAG